MVRAEWSGANHVLHLLLTVVTLVLSVVILGLWLPLWLPVWLIVSLGGAYHCSICGRAAPDIAAPRPIRKLSEIPLERSRGETGVSVIVVGVLAAVVTAAIVLQVLRDMSWN